MCTGVEMALIGTAAQMAGTAYNGQQQAKSQKAMVSARNNAALAESTRQEKYQADADAEFNNSVKPYEGSQQQKTLADAITKRAGRTQGAVTESTAYATPTAKSAPSVVGSEIARKMADAATSSKRRAGALGRMNAWNDLQFGNRVNMVRQGDKLGEISNFAGRSAALLPLDQQSAANNAYKAPGMFGDLLTAAGAGLSLYGMTAAPTAASGLTAPNNSAWNGSALPAGFA